MNNFKAGDWVRFSQDNGDDDIILIDNEAECYSSTFLERSEL